MRIVRCIGKALGFKADGATTRIHSAMHAREARQIIAGVHDKPRLCGIDIHSAPTGRTDAGGGERELMQRGFLQDKTVVITVAVEQLQVFPVDAFAYGMVVAEIKRRIAHCPDFTGIVRIHVDRQVEIRVYPHQMVFNGGSGSFHARQVKIGMIGGTEQGVAVCLRLIIYTEPIVVRQGIHHPYRNIARKTGFSIGMEMPEEKLVFTRLLCFPHHRVKTVITTVQSIRNRVKL